MDSPIEKWNLIIGNLALKQVSDTRVYLQILGVTCKNEINFSVIKSTI